MYLYTNNELAEKEIKKIIHLAISSQRTKYLAINLTEEVNRPVY